MKQSIKFNLSLLFVFFSTSLCSENLYKINFEKIKASELLKFVSKITETNFISDDETLNFYTSFNASSGLTKKQILQVTLNIFEQHNLETNKKNDLYFIKTKKKIEPKPDFKIILKKLEYHKGSEILASLVKLIPTIDQKDKSLKTSFESLQWIESSNSLMYKADSNSQEKISSLIERLDTPLKQVFIEILVVETSMQKGLEFGLDWSMRSGKNTSRSLDCHIENTSINRGFELGIIGDLIKHKSNTFSSISTLVTALGQDINNSIVLNQKIITQENKCSHIFVGDNIPFASSVVETQGNLQQKTANVEYKDIGVCLNITPSLGSDGIITLDINEEITEASEHLASNMQQISGIKTSKTNMKTQAHIPDRHFFILSGMTRTKKKTRVKGIPLIKNIPFLSSLFSKEVTENEKRSILIFVKPQIIQTQDEYLKISRKLKT